jgi:UDP-3-O-[3-hydroxymyristoyl] glucosamine N-acyltransferase
MSNIHPAAIVAPDTVIESDVEIGPYAVIGYDFSAARARYYGRAARKSQGTPVVLKYGAHIGPHVVVGAGAVIGDCTIIEPGCYIGERSRIQRRGFVRYGARIYARVAIGEDCIIGGIVCNHTVIGDRVAMFGSTLHRFAGTRASIREPAPVLEDDIIVGFGALIIGELTIRKGSIVKAGSIVTDSDRQHPRDR